MLYHVGASLRLLADLDSSFSVKSPPVETTSRPNKVTIVDASAQNCSGDGRDLHPTKVVRRAGRAGCSIGRPKWIMRDKEVALIMQSTFAGSPFESKRSLAKRRKAAWSALRQHLRNTCLKTRIVARLSHSIACLPSQSGAVSCLKLASQCGRWFVLMRPIARSSLYRVLFSQCPRKS